MQGTKRLCKVLAVRDLTDTTFVLTIERKDLRFTAGQHLALGLPATGESREYSVYSAEQDPAMELLIREVAEGAMTPLFRQLRPGDDVNLYEPVGGFVLPPGPARPPLLFVATGTGIAPFHSFVRTNPGLDYRLLHGVRHGSEDYERDHYEASRYTLCTSGDRTGDYAGRVTGWLKEHRIAPQTLCYLCGNYAMITEASSILEDKGVPLENIRSEIYFYSLA